MADSNRTVEYRSKAATFSNSSFSSKFHELLRNERLSEYSIVRLKSIARDIRGTMAISKSRERSVWRDRSTVERGVGVENHARGGQETWNYNKDIFRELSRGSNAILEPRAIAKAPEGEGCPRCGGYVYAAEQMLARGRVSFLHENGTQCLTWCRGRRT